MKNRYCKAHFSQGLLLLLVWLFSLNVFAKDVVIYIGYDVSGSMNESIVGKDAHQLIKDDIKNLLFHGDIRRAVDRGGFTSEIEASPHVQHSSELPLWRAYNNVALSLFAVGNRFECAWRGNRSSKCPATTLSPDNWPQFERELPDPSRFTDGTSRLNLAHEFIVSELKSVFSQVDKDIYFLWVTDNKLFSSSKVELERNNQTRFSDEIRQANYLFEIIYDRRVENASAYQQAVRQYRRGLLRGFTSEQDIPTGFHIQLLKFQHKDYLPPAQLQLQFTSVGGSRLSWRPNNFSASNSSSSNTDWAERYIVQEYQNGRWKKAVELAGKGESQHLYQVKIPQQKSETNKTNGQRQFRVVGVLNKNGLKIQKSSLTHSEPNYRLQQVENRTEAEIVGTDGAEIFIEKEVNGRWEPLETLKTPSDSWKIPANNRNRFRIRSSAKTGVVEVPATPQSNIPSQFLPEEQHANGLASFSWDAAEYQQGNVLLQVQETAGSWRDLQSTKAVTGLIQEPSLSGGEVVRLQYQYSDNILINSQEFLIDEDLKKATENTEPNAAEEPQDSSENATNEQTNNEPGSSGGAGFVVLLLIAGAAAYYFFVMRGAGKAESIQLKLLRSGNDNEGEERFFTIADEGYLYFDQAVQKAEKSQVWDIGVKDCYITYKNKQFKLTNGDKSTAFTIGETVNLETKSKGKLRLKRISVSSEPKNDKKLLIETSKGTTTKGKI